MDNDNFDFEWEEARRLEVAWIATIGNGEETVEVEVYDGTDPAAVMDVVSWLLLDKEERSGMYDALPEDDYDYQGGE